MRCALDSNVLAYWAGAVVAASDEAKIKHIGALLASIGHDHDLVLPTQVLAETYRVLLKSRTNAAQAAQLIRRYAEALEVVPTTLRTLEEGLDLASVHRLQIFDAIILSAAADAGCTLLLTEDMQHGFRHRGVTVVDPFASPAHPKLAALLA